MEAEAEAIKNATSVVKLDTSLAPALRQRVLVADTVVVAVVVAVAVEATVLSEAVEVVEVKKAGMIGNQSL